MAIKGTVVPSEAVLMLKITIFMIIITTHQVSICFLKKKKNYFVIPGLHCSIWDLWLWLAGSSSLTRD